MGLSGSCSAAWRLCRLSWVGMGRNTRVLTLPGPLPRTLLRLRLGWSLHKPTSSQILPGHPHRDSCSGQYSLSVSHPAKAGLGLGP